LLPLITLPREARSFLDRLLQVRLLSASMADAFLAQRNDFLAQYSTAEKLGRALIQADLLTHYQLERALRDDLSGLVLGPYRVLDRIGVGGMGAVYLAEHNLMKRRVAVKVLPIDDECHPAIRERFYAEMRVLAELSHPNIVQAFDAGELQPKDPSAPGTQGLIYLVMELVDGGDLDRRTVDHGPCRIAEGCNYIRQAAAGLQAAHDRHLIHRDIKPSNILLSRLGQAKLVDFGLARRFTSKLTDPRSLLGSVEFMPPEQSYDPSSVGKEADIYGLGATLFWLLTGEGPYPFTRHVGTALRRLQTEPPRRLRELLPEAPPALDDLLARMLDRDPARRPAQPLAVVNALTSFLIDASGKCLLNLRDVWVGLPSGRERTSCPNLSQDEEPVLTPLPQQAEEEQPSPIGRRILVVDDEESVRTLHRLLLTLIGYDCEEAVDGESALAAAKRQRIDLVLLDLNLPGIDGYEVCRGLRAMPGNPFLKILVVSGMGDSNQLSNTLPAGADDYIVKPFENRQLLAKVEHAFQIKDAQERSTLLAEQLLITNCQLEQSLRARDQDVRDAHNALLFTMAKMAESRDGETAGHLKRLRAYSRVLAREAARKIPWRGLVDARFLSQLERCVVLHDIGKIGLPEEVLMKPGALNATERALVETHPLIGDRILEALSKEHGNSLEFLGMARDIVRHHHERFDGRGYPDRLGGDAIPASARLVAIADVYDALRRQRFHKPAMTHEATLRVMCTRSEGQFDPALLEALQNCQEEFARIYEMIGD